jgi:hypothetical protein
MEKTLVIHKKKFLVVHKTLGKFLGKKFVKRWENWDRDIKDFPMPKHHEIVTSSVDGQKKKYISACLALYLVQKINPKSYKSCAEIISKKWMLEHEKSTEYFENYPGFSLNPIHFMDRTEMKLKPKRKRKNVPVSKREKDYANDEEKKIELRPLKATNSVAVKSGTHDAKDDDLKSFIKNMEQREQERETKQRLKEERERERDENEKRTRLNIEKLLTRLCSSELDLLSEIEKKRELDKLYNESMERCKGLEMEILEERIEREKEKENLEGRLIQTACHLERTSHQYRLEYEARHAAERKRQHVELELQEEKKEKQKIEQERVLDQKSLVELRTHNQQLFSQVTTEAKRADENMQQVVVANTLANEAEDEAFGTLVEMKETNDKYLQQGDYESRPRTWEAFNPINIQRDLLGDYKRSKEFKDLIDSTLNDIAYELFNAREKKFVSTQEILEFIKTKFYKNWWNLRGVHSVTLKTKSIIFSHLKSALHLTNLPRSSRHIPFEVLHQKCQETVSFLRGKGVEKEIILLAALNNFADKHGIEIPDLIGHEDE